MKIPVFNVALNMNGCDYVLHADGTFDIAGTSCAGITFEGAGCKLTMTVQNGLNGVTYTNEGTGTTREVTVTPSITGIAYHAAGLCPRTGSFTDGNYTSGPFQITGEDTGIHRGVWCGRACASSGRHACREHDADGAKLEEGKGWSMKS